MYNTSSLTGNERGRNVLTKNRISSMKMKGTKHFQLVWLVCIGAAELLCFYVNFRFRCYQMKCAFFARGSKFHQMTKYIMEILSNFWMCWKYFQPKINQIQISQIDNRVLLRLFSDEKCTLCISSVCLMFLIPLVFSFLSLLLQTFSAASILQFMWFCAIANHNISIAIFPCFISKNNQKRPTS